MKQGLGPILFVLIHASVLPSICLYQCDCPGTPATKQLTLKAKSGGVESLLKGAVQGSDPDNP